MTGAPYKDFFEKPLPVTCDEALRYLYTLRRFGTHLGLSRISALLHALGRPDTHYQAIHVAGTNGKGSTTTFCARILEEMGARVGLFTSPHLARFNERISVNGTLISDADILASLKSVVAACRTIMAEGHDESPTFFEIITAMAAEYFARQKCTHVIWETGMGGRLDATNAVQKQCAVITNVSRDHTEWLGNTIEDIAKEKAGIIATGIPVVTATSGTDAAPVIAHVAAEKNAPLYWISRDKDRINREDILVDKCQNDNFYIKNASDTLGPYSVALRGEIYHVNAALAVVATSLITKNVPLDTSPSYYAASRSALEKATVMGRFQHMSTDPHIYVDVAHNPAAFEALMSSVASVPARRKVLCIGLLRDKEIREIITICAPHISELWYVPPESDRAYSAEEFCTVLQDMHDIPSCTTTCKSAQEVLQKIYMDRCKDSIYVIAGSCYLAGAILREHGNTSCEGVALYDLSDPLER